MVFDAGGGSARRRHRFPSSRSALLVSWYLVLLSVLIPGAPPPRTSRSPSSACLKSIDSSASRSSSRHSSVLSSATTFQTSATSPMLSPDLAPQGSTAPLIIAVSPTPPSLSTVPPCTSGDTRSTHPEQRLARSGRFCISKAPPPLHTASDPFADAVTPSCCSVSYLDYTVHQCRSDLVSFTIAANLRRLDEEASLTRVASRLFQFGVQIRPPPPSSTCASHQPSSASLRALIMMYLHLSLSQHCVNAKYSMEISYS
ncbi:BnaA09g09010D [Brassica napus]|uniref:BnaA09g09010D protein n=1 Tax=Brassica napus TaxID=3708 RepID=A0A078IBH0_BRANA|nr:BnaA09g09010D [Brassica napus]